MCLHKNAVVTLYEEKVTVYTLREGVIDTVDTSEAYPLERGDIACPDCGLNTTYTDWRHDAPEPLRTGIEHMYQQQEHEA